MVPSTVLRRICDCSGWSVGSHFEGLCVMPAIVAACRYVRSLACVPPK
jgi:hypothetical protein